MELQHLKLWFNPEKKWYEIFLPDGTDISIGNYQVRVQKIDDSLERITTAIFKSIVEVVNERPISKCGASEIGQNTGEITL